MSAIVSSAYAHRLAWHDGEQYRTSEYGYVEAGAALTAASTLNRVRVCRGRHPYSHVIAYQGERAVDVRALEAMA